MRSPATRLARNSSLFPAPADLSPHVLRPPVQVIVPRAEFLCQFICFKRLQKPALLICLLGPDNALPPVNIEYPFRREGPVRGSVERPPQPVPSPDIFEPFRRRAGYRRHETLRKHALHAD